MLITFFSILVSIGLHYLLLSNIFDRSKRSSILSKAVISSLFSLGISLLFSDFYVGPVILTILFAVGYYYANLYGELSYGSVASVLETNKDEAREYLSLIDKKAVGKVSFLSLAFFIAHASNIEIGVVAHYLAYFSAFLLLLSLISMVNIYLTDENKSNAAVKILKYNSILNIFSHVFEYLKYKRLTRSIEIKPNWSNVVKNRESSDVYIVVIGESACRDRFHVYGHDVKNTPEIKEMYGYKVVEDAIAPSTQTMTSIPRILSINDLEVGVDFDRNIIDLANEAGFETYWLSNQGKLGTADTAVTILASRAKNCKFLQSEYSTAGSDFDLINEVENILTNDKGTPKLIFLHTMGSHWNFCERSELGRYKIDKIDDQLDCYDNTIYNTYMMLEDIRTVLSEYDSKYKMVYFSDHGLAKTTEFPYLTHGVGKLFSYSAAEVPLFFINDSTTEDGEMLKETYYLRDFVHTLAEWLGIQADEVNEELSLFNTNRTKQSEYILDDSLKVIKR